MKLSTLFTDHAVLPVATPLPVWGTAAPDAWVRGRIGENTACVQAASDGSFLLRFAPVAEYGPVEFEVTDGVETVTLQDVQIGEVWLAAGQSNMGFTLSRELPEISPDELKRNDIRIFHVPERTRLTGPREAATAWKLLPERPADCNFTAVGFHFAAQVAAAKGCAVGVIQASLGGASLAAFLNRENALQYYPQPDEAEKYFQQPPNDTPEKVADPIAAYLREKPVVLAEKSDKDDWQKVGYDDSGWNTQSLPDSWDMAGFEYYGAFRYRKTVVLPESWRGAELELSLGMIDQQDVTWFNGQQVGATGEGMEYACFATHRRYRVSAELVRPGEANLVAVRPVSLMSMFLHGGFVGPADEMKLTNLATGEAISLAGEWRFEAEQACEPQLTTLQYQLMGAGIQHSLGILYENFLKPIIPYALTGVIWYQGEADSTEPEMAKSYYDGLSMLREQCEADWNLALPFLVVQLPGCCMPQPYQEVGNWAVTRQAQLDFMKDSDEFPAVIADACSDPAELHFPNKRVVGDRLARLWLHGQDAETPAPAKAHGPAMMNYQRFSHAVELHYDAVGEGLAWRDGVVSPAFYVAGAKGEYEPAAARIVAPDTIRLESPNIKKITSVRYCWSQNPGPFLTLVNSEGLPASPEEMMLS